jgi:hypothetical protein
MFRADVVRSRRPFFEEGRLHEDTELCDELLKTSDFAFVHQVLTFLRSGNEGVWRGPGRSIRICSTSSSC